jgi:hypothetical protein
MNAFSNPRRFASALNLFLNPDTQRWGCPGRVNFFLPQSKHVQKDNEQGIASDAEEVWGLGSRIIAARMDFGRSAFHSIPRLLCIRTSRGCENRLTRIADRSRSRCC